MLNSGKGLAERELNEELNAAKHFNKLAVVMIIIMIVWMGTIIVNTWYWAEQYRQLELKYEELYEKRDSGNELNYVKDN